MKIFTWVVLLISLSLPGVIIWSASKKLTPYERSLECMQMQLDLYADICGEAVGTDPEDDQSQISAHWFGAKCAIEAALQCAKDYK